MWNRIIAFRDSIINKFGPVLGYAILILGGLIAISFIGFLVKVLFNIVVALAIAAIVFFGAYKLYELIKSNK